MNQEFKDKLVNHLETEYHQQIVFIEGERYPKLKHCYAYVTGATRLDDNHFVLSFIIVQSPTQELVDKFITLQEDYENYDQVFTEVKLCDNLTEWFVDCKKHFDSLQNNLIQNIKSTITYTN
jgi:hypothetical protein